MKYFGPRGRTWLKATHVFFACIWTGTVACLLSLSLAQQPPQSIDALSGYLSAVDNLETTLIPLGALGCFITGVCFSLFTKWGFMKFWWILVKWIGTVTVMVAGASFGRRLHASLELLHKEGLQALHNPTFLKNQTIMAVLKPANALILGGIFFLSYLKPWGARK